VVQNESEAVIDCKGGKDCCCWCRCL